jgi:hypothetical protein
MPEMPLIVAVIHHHIAAAHSSHIVLLGSLAFKLIESVSKAEHEILGKPVGAAVADVVF